jgi:integrase
VRFDLLVDEEEGRTRVTMPGGQPALSSHAHAVAESEIEAAKAYGRAAKSTSTRREYARDWTTFAAWCADRGLASLPASPPTVARYVATLAPRLKVASIRRRVVAISQQHKEWGFESPSAHKIVREVLTGIANTHGSAQTMKSALSADLLPAALLALGEGLRARRDRAILLLGFAGGFRRSELAALDLADLRFERRGLVVTVRKSKTDQAGEGREVAIPFVGNAQLCPVHALQTWLGAAAISSGPVFVTFALPRGRGDRSERLQDHRIDGRDVARIVQRAVTRAGLAGDFAAHSLRAGFVTSAAQKKIPEVDIQRVTGHRSVAVLRRYVRRATLFEDAPLTSILG